MAPTPTIRKLLLDPTIHMLILAVALVGFKLYSLEVVSRTYLACQWCLTAKSVPHETQFMLLLLALHMVSCIFRSRPVRVLFRAFVILATIVTAMDLAVTHQFWTRLTAAEFVEFFDEPHAVATYLQQALSSGWLKLGAALGIVALLTIFARYLKDNRPAIAPLFLYLMIGAGLVGCQWAETPEYHDTFLQNSLQVFFSRPTSTIPYTKEFAAAVADQPSSHKTCSPGAGQRNDIILVVFESLSMYHSALYSGINDWMPEFDALSKTGVRYTNFYANGVTSEQGLVALLTGEPPIARGMSTKTLFEQFHNPAQTVPRMLHGLGYGSAFLTTGNLSFMNKGQWLKNIGFDDISGHDDPFYQGMQRYNFDAAPDEALYARALQQLQKPRDHPLFMTLETVSTHLPNVNPETGDHSQESTYRYADRVLGQFVRKLRAQGFFDHGTLIITADHRAMVPMSTQERALYGDRAFVRVPMTIIGTGLGERVEQASFSQTDLLPSLRNTLAQGEHCVGPNQGVFLPTAAHAPQCIFTNRSYNTNNVYAHCGHDDYTIELNGDKTQYADAPPSDPPDLLNEVHRLRLGRGFLQ